MVSNEGTTSILHDTEERTNVTSCAAAGCYARQIKYSATTRQMTMLADISASCQQYFKVHNTYLFAECIGGMIFLKFEIYSSLNRFRFLSKSTAFNTVSGTIATVTSRSSGPVQQIQSTPASAVVKAQTVASITNRLVIQIVWRPSSFSMKVTSLRHRCFP